MAAKFKKGDAVRQVQSAPVRGTVQGFGLDQETGDVTVRVGWVDAEGHVGEVFLPLDHLEEDPDAAAETVDSAEPTD